MSAPDEVRFDLWDDYAYMVARFIASHERSQQVEIGASELGTPCHRKMAYRLAALPAVRGENSTTEATEVADAIRNAEWRPAVGTAVHKATLAAMLEAQNAVELASPMHGDNGRCTASWCSAGPRTPLDQHIPRFAVELEVVCGTVNGQEIRGHIDFYDRMRRVIGDWKIVGPKTLKDKRVLVLREDDPSPGEGYRVQAQVYGRGVARGLGWPVDHVAVIFLPMNGELRDGFVWSEPYDPEVSARTFKRARTFAGHLDTAGNDPEAVAAFLARLGTVNDYCHRCDWFRPGHRGPLTEGCPGDKSMFADSAGASSSVDGLIE